MESNQRHKELALQFLNLIVSGAIDEAYRTCVNMSGMHHNAFFPAGFTALREAMKANHAEFPHKRLTAKHVTADGDFVVTHSHLVFKDNEPGMVVVHMFRFENEKIIELWDCGQMIPSDCPNTDGVF